MKRLLSQLAFILTPEDPSGSSLTEFADWLTDQPGWNLSRLGEEDWIRSKFGFWKKNLHKLGSEMKLSSERKIIALGIKIASDSLIRGISRILGEKPTLSPHIPAPTIGWIWSSIIDPSLVPSFQSLMKKEFGIINVKENVRGISITGKDADLVSYQISLSYDSMNPGFHGPYKGLVLWITQPKISPSELSGRQLDDIKERALKKLTLLEKRVLGLLES